MGQEYEIVGAAGSDRDEIPVVQQTRRAVCFQGPSWLPSFGAGRQGTWPHHIYTHLLPAHCPSFENLTQEMGSDT